jgi:serine/threonine protein kinase
MVIKGNMEPLHSLELTIPPLESLLNSSDNPNDLYRRFESFRGYTNFHAIANHSGKKVTIFTETFPDELQDKLGAAEALHILRTTHHPHICHFIDAYKHREQYWQAFEYIHGISLWHLLNSSHGVRVCLKERQIAFVFQAIAKVLSYFQGKEILHRDVKSENILLSCDGEVKLSM